MSRSDWGLEVQQAYIAYVCVALAFRLDHDVYANDAPANAGRHIEHRAIVPFDVVNNEAAVENICKTAMSALKDCGEISVKFGGVAGADYGLVPSAVVIFNGTASTT